MNNFGLNYNLKHSLKNPHKVIWDFYNQCKWVVQRGFRGYADCDTWSLDSYLCEWMPEALTTLRDRNIGYPADLTAKKWKHIQTKVIEGFKAHRRLVDLSYKGPNDPKYKKDKKLAEEGLKLFAERFGSFWD